jgi:hypothetical protein
MPVRRFRDVSAMPPSEPYPPGDGRNLLLALQLSELACRLGAVRAVRGVRRFRSVEEKARWEEGVRGALREG